MRRQLLVRLVGSVLLVVLSIARSWADGGLGSFSWSGAVRTDYFSSSHTLDDKTDYYGVSIEPKLTDDFSESVNALLQFRASAFDLGHASAHTHLSLLQGYLALYGNKYDVRVGKQLVSWGRADGINPTAYFTPHDYVLPLPLEADQRLGVTAARFDYNFDYTNSLQLVGEPGFEPSTLPWPSDSPIVRIESEPGQNRRNFQWGVRFDHEGDTVGWSFSHFHGFSSLPLLSPMGTSGTAPVFRVHYPRISAYGADVARNFGRIGLRAEVAYIKPDNDSAQPPPLSPYWFAVAGGDYTFDDTWNLNVQGVWRKATRYVDPTSYADPLTQAAAIQNGLTYGLTDNQNLGMTMRLSRQWLHDTLSGQLLVYMYFKPTNYMLRPLVTYAMTDSLKLIGGAQYYYGPSDSYLGQLKRNNTVFFEVNYGF